MTRLQREDRIINLEFALASALDAIFYADRDPEKALEKLNRAKREFLNKKPRAGKFRAVRRRIQQEKRRRAQEAA